MYSQSTVSIKSSASLLYNNLDALISGGEIQYAVVHKSNVWIFNPKEVKDNQSAYKRVVCKGEGTQASSSILQARWCVLPQRTLLVVASVKGAQMFESVGNSAMVFWQALQPHPKEGHPQFARGITAVSGRFICVGTADGSIFVFDIPDKGNGVKLQESLTIHSHPITDLHANDDCMVSADDLGTLVLWKAGGAFTKIRQIEGYGYPCTSVRLLERSILAAYGSGHIRQFNRDSGIIQVEVAAHAKWINAIDVSDDEKMVCSVSEDTYVRVWKLDKFELKFQSSITDVQLTGTKFIDRIGNTFAITGYDSNDIVVFKK